MSGRDRMEEGALAAVDQPGGADLLRALAEAAPATPLHGAAPGGVVIGELIGMADEGRTPLVLFPGQPGSAALAARTVVDLHGPHIGSRVVLMFEGADPAKPIVMGVLAEDGNRPLAEQPGQVEVDSDGERLIVSAKEQLVLRCGKASITLTRAGKVLLQGSYVLSRASGVNRVRGGSVQIN